MHLILTALASPFLHLCCLILFIQAFRGCSLTEFGPSWSSWSHFMLLAVANNPVLLLLPL